MSPHGTASVKLFDGATFIRNQHTRSEHLTWGIPDIMEDIEMQYTITFNGRMIQATYELINSEIVVSGVKVMTEGTWEEQNGDVLEDFGQWMIKEYSDEMMSSW